MAKKKRNSGEDDIEAYRREADTCTTAVPVGLILYVSGGVNAREEILCQ